MSDDLIEQFAKLEVREPPAEFDRQLHTRLNRWLLAQHLLALVAAAFPWAVLHFFRAVAGAIAMTISGRYDASRTKNPDEPM